jgi:hypothetical protein
MNQNKKKCIIIVKILHAQQKNKSKINSKSIELPKSKLTQKHKIS